MSGLSRKYVLPAIVVLLVGAAASYMYFSRGNDSVTNEEGINTGYLVTDVMIPLLDGDTVRFSDYDGELLVVDFMAPWCAPCREQFKVLKELNEHPNVEIITINIDSRYNSSALRQFAEDEGITWSLGSSPMAGGVYQINAIPTILFVDEEGVIRYRGFFTTLNQFEQLLQSFG
jgi:thiol-disulfide isomerase/thioredoxin